MVRHKLSESEPESPESSSSEESEAEGAAICQRNEEGVSDYEKQRLSRIADNKAIMEALGLRNIASSLMGTAQNLSKKKGKAKVIEDDEDYKPDDVVARSSSEREEEEDDDGDNLGRRSIWSNKSKGKNKTSSRKKRDPNRKISTNSDYIDDDDALLRAIALSLQISTEVSKVVDRGHSEASDLADDNVKERRGKVQTQEETGRRKRKKPFVSRLQMTEDELLLHFYQFDEEWKGDISTKDLRRVATAHDFTWTDKDLTDMILCFDSDGDGKLSLDDFRKIVVRCNMIEGSKGS